MRRFGYDHGNMLMPDTGVGVDPPRVAGAGWEAIADRFVAIRSGVGASLMRAWAEEHLLGGAPIVDVGCGSGVPIARALADGGFAVWGIDASPSLIAAFRRNVPEAPAICEPAQDSILFGRSFAGAVSIGLIFLLDPADQHRLIARLADALEPGGRFLFSAPREACEWRDTLTDQRSISLGALEYTRLLDRAGLRLDRCHLDEGGNHYYDAVKPA